MDLTAIELLKQAPTLALAWLALTELRTMRESLVDLSKHVAILHDRDRAREEERRGVTSQA